MGRYPRSSQVGSGVSLGPVADPASRPGLASAAGWSRVGGRRSSFVCTHQELQSLLGDLPQDLRPWRLTGSDLVPSSSGRFEQRAFICEGS